MADGKECACNVGDPGLIPLLERSPGEKVETHSHILAWEILWTEKSGMGSQESDMTQRLNKPTRVEVTLVTQLLSLSNILLLNRVFNMVYIL